MMEKMLTFEEWKEGDAKPLFDSLLLNGALAESIWNKARQGMIPADRAIEVGEIDRGGKALNEAGWAFIKACNEFGIRLDGNQWNNCKQDIVYPTIKAYLDNAIPHPTPQWSPKIGEAVFILEPTHPLKSVLTGRVTGKAFGGYSVRVTNHELDMAFNLVMLKPFRPEAIGLPWSQI